MTWRRFAGVVEVDIAEAAEVAAWVYHSPVYGSYLRHRLIVPAAHHRT